jgi:hypothetical protein
MSPGRSPRKGPPRPAWPVEDQVERELELALVDTVPHLKDGHPRRKDVIAI